MGSCALVYFKQEHEESPNKKGLFGRIKDVFGGDGQKGEAKIHVETIFEAMDFIMMVFEIPLKQSDFMKMKRKRLQRFNEQLRRLCEDNQIKNCYLPQSALFVPESCKKSSFNGKMLFKCLLKDLLDLIYTKRGINIGDLNIAIAEGEDNGELQAILEILAPLARYVSLLTTRREQVEQIVESLYEEYGLCIGISEDYKRGFKDADLVINLGRLEGFITRPKFGSNAVIVNYGKLDNSYISDSVTMIRGIEVGLPGRSFKLLADRTEAFSVNELAELLILNKLDLEIVPATLSSDLINAVSKEFKVCGMVIRNLKGNNNTLNVNFT